MTQSCSLFFASSEFVVTRSDCGAPLKLGKILRADYIETTWEKRSQEKNNNIKFNDLLYSHLVD